MSHQSLFTFSETHVVPSLKCIRFPEFTSQGPTAGFYSSNRKKPVQSCQSFSGHVYTNKTQTLFEFTRLFDTNMETRLLTTEGKRLWILSRLNLRRYSVYLSRLSTLAAKKTCNKFHQHKTNVPLKAYLRARISPIR